LIKISETLKRLSTEEEEEVSFDNLDDHDTHIQNHQQIMMMIAQMDMRMQTLLESSIAMQGIIAGIVGLMARSHLKRDRAIKNELKMLAKATSVLDANAKKMKQLMDTEKALKFGMLNIKRMDIPQMEDEDKDSHAYG
jgi:hypothetical protein